LSGRHRQMLFLPSTGGRGWTRVDPTHPISFRSSITLALIVSIPKQHLIRTTL
jgi:hypothetical protein